MNAGFAVLVLFVGLVHGDLEAEAFAAFELNKKGHLKF